MRWTMRRGRRVDRPSITWGALGAAPLAVYALFIGVPLAALLVRGVAEDGFWSSFGGGTVLDALRLSLITSAISTAVIALLGTPAAYMLARSKFRGHTVADALIELPLVLPPVVAGLAMLMAFGRNSAIGEALEGIGVSLPFTMIAVVFAQIFVGAPFFLRAAKLGFQSVDRELEEIARTLGASPLRAFFRVSLPLARPALAGGLALAWARAIAEFGATIMFAGNLPGRTQTMPLAILSALESDLGAALALAVLLLAVALVVLTGGRLVAGGGESRP